MLLVVRISDIRNKLWSSLKEQDHVGITAPGRDILPLVMGGLCLSIIVEVESISNMFYLQAGHW